MFSGANLKKIEELKKRYPTTQALTLPVLWIAQEQFGWLSPEVMKYVAGLLDVPVGHIYGVVTFYTMFNPTPIGRYHLQVCTNVSCQLRGAEKLLDHVCRKLKVSAGGTTGDKQFTVSEVECLGSCGTAPMIQVNDDYHENLTVEKTDHLLDELSKK